MNFFASWEVAINLVPRSRTQKEEYWELVIRNLEKGVCVWISQSGSRPDTMIKHGKSLQNTFPAEALAKIESLGGVKVLKSFVLIVGIARLGHILWPFPQFLRVGKTVQMVDVYHPPVPGSPFLSQWSHEEGDQRELCHTHKSPPRLTSLLPEPRANLTPAKGLIRCHH